MKYISITVLAIILLAPVLSSISHGEESKLKIIYTGTLQGQLEPCGCSPKSDFGGIARVSGYIETHKEELSPYVLIDSGNFSGKNTPQGKLKTEAMLKFLNIMKYDAVGFSENEAAFQDDLFTKTLKDYDLPFLSSLPGHAKSAALSINGFNINISADPKDFKSEKLNILLTALPVSDAEHLKGWDIIITSSGEEYEEPAMAGETVIVAGYPKGKKIGILTLTHDKDGKINYTHRWQPTGNDIEVTKTADSILADYNTKVAALMNDMERPPEGITYTGADKCILCHQPFVEKWENSRHANAFASLEMVGKAADPECISCHVVGFREKGGFFTIETTPEFANVQCEACHGIGREHLSDYSIPMKPVNEETCLKCHTEENSPEFEYPVYLEKITH